ncbi:hypothetical protein CRUP_026841 [Coryphaenoides rupestris]|nr:hypothetical protein CRUP_026841 [Coryphaenoides rupestris]
MRSEMKKYKEEVRRRGEEREEEEERRRGEEEERKRGEEEEEERRRGEEEEEEGRRRRRRRRRGEWVRKRRGGGVRRRRGGGPAEGSVFTQQLSASGHNEAAMLQPATPIGQTPGQHSSDCVLQSFGTSAMLGPVVMPMDMAMRFYIAHSPPPLRGLLSSSYEDLQRGVRSRAGQTQRGSRQASPQGRYRPLRPCLSSPRRAPDIRKKRVVFADSRGLALTAVHVFSDQQSRAAACEDLMFQMSDLEKVTMEMKVQTSRSLELDFQQPSADYLDFRARLLRNSLCLESCSLQQRSLTGTVKVRNLGFRKSVAVRITFDSWVSCSDTPCTFMNNVYGCQDTDTFAFSLELPAHVSAQQRVEFCLCYWVEGQEFWDNNDGRNYTMRHAGWKEELPTSPAPPPTATDPKKPPGDPGRHGGVRLLDVELDQFGSPRTSSGLFPGWQSWGTAEVSVPYW